jgi:hypothetical protein
LHGRGVTPVTSTRAPIVIGWECADYGRLRYLWPGGLKGEAKRLGLDASYLNESSRQREEEERCTMIESKLTLAEIFLIGGTRVALGMGVGLLLAGRLNSDQRRAAGIALAVVGGLTTIPLALNVLSKARPGD